MAPLFFNSRTETKKISSHVFSSRM
ncbi:DUF1661 domain-containing protein [Porphyromonas gulae]